MEMKCKCWSNQDCADESWDTGIGEWHGWFSGSRICPEPSVNPFVFALIYWGEKLPLWVLISCSWMQPGANLWKTLWRCSLMALGRFKSLWTSFPQPAHFHCWINAENWIFIIFQWLKKKKALQDCSFLPGLWISPSAPTDAEWGSSARNSCHKAHSDCPGTLPQPLAPCGAFFSLV